MMSNSPDMRLPANACRGCGGPAGDTAGPGPGTPPLCDDCRMERLLRPRRKTHWQYLNSIKGEYLIDPAPREG
jgi:hypothetical protein